MPRCTWATGRPSASSKYGEFLHSGIAAVGGVLLVNGIDHGAVSCGPFCSQGWVRTGGGRVGGTITTDRRASILPSGIRIVGSRLGTVGYRGVAGFVGRV